MQDGTIKAMPAELQFDTTYVDTSFDLPPLLRLFEQQQNIEELLQQSPQKELSKESLELVSDIVGKEYTRCRVYELEDIGGFPVVPYFVVQAYGQVYGMTSMGLGEVALHYIIWHLSRVKENALILIEEPESYVSVRAQKELMNHVAEVCVKKKATAIISTHSPTVFARIPPEHTAILYREKDVFRIVAADTHELRLLALGLPPAIEAKKDGIILVEDRMGKTMTHYIVSYFDRGLLAKTEIVIAPNGAGQIVSVVAKFPPTRIRVIGLLDGDQKGRHDNHECLTFLPGDVAPEILLKEIICSSQPRIAARLEIDPSKLGIILAAIEAMDPHDWFDNLHNQLGVTSESLFQAAFEEWIEGNEGAARNAFDALRMALHLQ